MSENTLQYKGRPGSIDLGSQEYAIFPFDIFELDDANRVDEPVLKLKSPWKFYIIDAGYIGFVSRSGTSDYNNPGEGDYRVYISGSELKFEEYTNGAWSDANAVRLGGLDSNGTLISGIACRQWSNPLADEINQEVFPGGHVVTFESNFDTQQGLSPSTNTDFARDSGWSKFGTYGIVITSPWTGPLLIYDLPLENDNLSAGVGHWFIQYALSTASSVYWDFTYWYVKQDSNNYYVFNLQVNRVTCAIRGHFAKTVSGITTDTYTNALSYSLNTDNYVAIGFDNDTSEMYVTLNDEKESVSVSMPSAYSTISEKYVAYHIASTGSGDPDAKGYHRIDEFQFLIGDTVNADLFLQHYTHNQPWNTDYSAKDCVVNLPPGGLLRVNPEWHLIGESGEPTFENSWVNYGGPTEPAGFTKRGDNTIELKGLVKSGTIGNGIFTLPIGYRPLFQRHIATIANDAFAFLRIEQDGTVCAYAGSNVWYSLDGIRFDIKG